MHFCEMERIARNRIRNKVFMATLLDFFSATAACRAADNFFTLQISEWNYIICKLLTIVVVIITIILGSCSAEYG